MEGTERATAWTVWCCIAAGITCFAWIVLSIEVCGWQATLEVFGSFFLVVLVVGALVFGAHKIYSTKRAKK